MNSETSTLKADKSVFTIADGIVQHLLVTHLFAPLKLGGIVGEEDSSVEITTRPYTVENLKVPEEMQDLVDTTRVQIDTLGAALVAQLESDAALRETVSGLTAFIDPIDGTREFASGKGEQCSVCIGFANQHGAAVAGVVYRPITEPVTWAAGAQSESFKAGELDMSAERSLDGLLTSNGSISPFIEALMDRGKLQQVPSGGAGNKMLMLLEGKGAAYIQDRGVSRWDTCAAEAVIDAHGGLLCKLPAIVSASEAEQYAYRVTEENLDFVSGLSNLTPHNCRSGVQLEKDQKVSAVDVSLLKPYSNLMGLFALANAEPDSREPFAAAVRAAAEVVAPSYN